ncbi:precorrin-4 C(11)-methyltransferase [Chitinispirillales bacterium ANBcel5]|uniref:precorrin-4 C(11)-methyltransferase n=1 Tax=Cellulosispirillum alkaliphilum TaxID=3039283 RepID=UPI002A4E8676|nr:precorrin-4 C(11)-methyltransferase [Chitinispirillales bacterium ANBcel5]
MKLYFVGAGPGDPELLTLKAARLLSECVCCIYAGSLVPETVTGMVNKDAVLYDSSRMTLDQIIATMKSYADKDCTVVRLHTGEPSLYGAIGEQMARLDACGIEYEIVPGVSSYQAAAAALKCELTVPGGSQTVILSRVAGRTPVPKEQSLGNIAPLKATLCLFLSVGAMDTIVKELSPHYGSDCPVAVVMYASRKNQKVVRGTLITIAEQIAKSDIKKTAMVIIGEALSGSQSESYLYNKFFSHEYRDAQS